MAPATHGAVGANRCTARHPHTPSHGRVLADAHVVPDLDQVVELHAVFDHRVLQAPRSMQVLAPISTSSPMRTAAQLLDLDPLPVGLGRKAKTISADDHPRCARCNARRCWQPSPTVTRDLSTLTPRIAVRAHRTFGAPLDHAQRPNGHRRVPPAPRDRPLRWGGPQAPARGHCAAATTA